MIEEKEEDLKEKRKLPSWTTQLIPMKVFQVCKNQLCGLNEQEEGTVLECERVCLELVMLFIKWPAASY